MRMSFFLVLLFLVSCSSNPKKKGAEDDPMLDPNGEFDHITKEQFQKPKPVPYRPRKDYFKEVESPKTSALNDESIFRVENDVKEDLEDKEDFLVKLASLCYQDKHKEAFELIDIHHDAYRTNPVFWNQVGTCFLQKDDYRKALLYYNKALEFNASYTPSLNNIGVLYRKQGEDAKAILAFERAIASGNLAKTPKFNLAQIYLEYDLVDKALSLFKILYRLDKNDQDVLNAMANCYLKLGQPQMALRYYKNIEGESLEIASIGINYAFALHLAGQEEKAIDAFEDIDSDKLGSWKKYYKKVKKEIY